MNRGGQVEIHRFGWRRVAAALGCVGILLLGGGSGIVAASEPAAEHPTTEPSVAEHPAPATEAAPSAPAQPATTTQLPAARLAARSGDVDAVLVIDSSGSMKQTDPHRLRIPAAKMFISLLDAKDRVGLISFSDNGYPIVHLTPADKQHQAQLFAGVEKVSSKGAYTNLHAALATGHAMLKREGDSQHRRMLVLMSDGKMDTGDFDKDQALLEKIRGETIDALVADGIEVYTIAFTEASDMPLMHEVAKRTAALSRLASNDRELHEVFSQIFESAKQPDMLPMEGGEFVVDAAVEEVTVVASKAKPDVEIKLQMPDGRMIAAINAGKAVRWFKSEQFDMITIDKPPAGQWHLLSSDNRGDKAYVVTHLGMDARIGEAPLYANTEQTGEAWLHDNGEVVVKAEILGQTHFNVEITQPDGAKLEMPLADAGMNGDRAAGDGAFANVFNFTQPGQQKIRVVAKNANFQREKALIVDVAAPPVDAKPPAAEEPAHETPPAAEAPKEEPPKEEAPKDEAPKDEAPPAEKGMNIGLIISLFVLVNLVVGGAVGGFIFWRRRKAAKAAAAADTDADEDEADDKNKKKKK
ncbi:MAG: VWA domain-containing protein [Gammaproteobacteria bacterium]|nr:VWA domain-containing protein [Gammaproteobacteria bacterium]